MNAAEEAMRGLVFDFSVEAASDGILRSIADVAPKRVSSMCRPGILVTRPSISWLRSGRRMSERSVRSHCSIAFLALHRRLRRTN